MTRRERQFITVAPALLALVMLFTFAQWMGWPSPPLNRIHHVFHGLHSIGDLALA